MNEKISLHPAHPERRLFFTEENHTYTDSSSLKYTSVTTLVGMGFKEFDELEAAQRRADRTGEDPEKLIKKWERIRTEASYRGTRLHKVCENYILGIEETRNYSGNSGRADQLQKGQKLY